MLSRWAAESIEQVAYVSYFLASLISVTVGPSTALPVMMHAKLTSVQLYLPRTYSASPGDLHVMVGGANRGGDDAVSNALMSLLREGGQWDEGDDKRTGTASAAPLKKESDDDEFTLETQRNSAVILPAFSPAWI